MAKFDAEAIARRLAQNVMDLNSDVITWVEFRERNRTAWALVAQDGLNGAGADIEHRYMQVQKYLDCLLQETLPPGVKPASFAQSAADR
ncbi:MAG: hypothetical protein IH606_22530 [Burkholderiales bacterium]|nr:hypothetical protein [Burkholderiales bacterium]